MGYDPVKVEFRKCSGPLGVQTDTGVELLLGYYFNPVKNDGAYKAPLL